MTQTLRTLLLGALLGLAILGVGGRLAMAAVAIGAGQASRWSLGGSMTVILLGAASGLAGAVIFLLSRAAMRRLPPRLAWLQYLVFGLALALITMRGLRGTDSNSHWYFYALVGLYGIALLLLEGRRTNTKGRANAL